MCPQYRQRQTSELNEQGKNDIPVRCQGACAKSRRFLEILQNILIDIKTFFILYAFFCQNTGTYSLKSPLTRVNSRFLRQQADRLHMARLFNEKHTHPLLYKGMVERTFSLKI